MNSIKNLERLQRLHQLIEQEATGSPKELAKRMHISERMVYNLIEQFKEFDACICYDRGRRTYYYGDDFQFKVSISVQINHDDLTKEIFGVSYLT
ncbi:MAG: HTH domain-containing protein [Maribacter sp.]|uniref:HTH domain-containing protein n=1 Tax=Maribacter sp. TaxID=1897614 RepID=UPI003298428A